jgi:hypothetical protein
MSFPPPKSTPLVAPGHTRPVTHLSFSPIQDDGTYLLVSSCKDGNPMLREWTGDWVGTFLGHKGAVWSTKLSPDASRAATGSADFTAFVFNRSVHVTIGYFCLTRPMFQQDLGYIFWKPTTFFPSQPHCPECGFIAFIFSLAYRRPREESSHVRPEQT